MSGKYKFLLIFLIFSIIWAFAFYTFDIVSYIRYELYPKSDMHIYISLINPKVRVIEADPSNKLYLKVKVVDNSGKAIPKAHIQLILNRKLGELQPANTWADKDGESLISYIPPSCIDSQLVKGNINLTITASLYQKEISNSVEIELTRTPVVYVHGYKADGSAFDNMKEYLSSLGIQGAAIAYRSEDGVVVSSQKLNSFLKQQTEVYLSRGIQVANYDIITHSLGGLVARYYSCSNDYIRNNNIRKIIFISVPQKGSPWASIAENYFNDQGIKDLIPDNLLLTKIMPSMINEGLNNRIQTGSIAVQYDEVVSVESASLEEWGINTEIFNIGENNLTMDNLINGNILDAVNHKSVINNKKVFEKVEGMLVSKLPYPAEK
jgi:hypothetical protein